MFDFAIQIAVHLNSIVKCENEVDSKIAPLSRVHRDLIDRVKFFLHVFAPADTMCV